MPICRFRLRAIESDYWGLGFPGAQVRLKGTTGLQYLGYLIAHPDEEFLALDLVARYRNCGTSIEVAGPIENGPLAGLDAAAKVAYRQRVAELRETLDEAESRNDLATAERARAQRSN